jgi:hypothetical protein
MSTRTARRRWSRDLEAEVDGIAITSAGPVLVHSYEPPAGGKWRDSVIPGKLAALDRHTGDVRWNSPCEVGYGRGFGAGLGASGEVLVLGPSQSGYCVARMDPASGELAEAREIEPFDEAHVGADLCLTLAARRVTALSSAGLTEAWRYARPKERYHLMARDGELVYVAFTSESARSQGILELDAQSGELRDTLLEPSQRVIHGLSAGGGAVAAIVSDLEQTADPETLEQRLVLGAGRRPGEVRGLGIAVLPRGARAGQAPLWVEALESDEDEFPEALIQLDAGKLYVARAALLDVVDVLTGRRLGRLTIPGLDEQVAFRVSQGAALLAEETRLSVFEIPD